MIYDTRQSRLRVLFAGGGSGGHLYPGLALADALGKRYGREVDVRFLATERSIDRRILGACNVAWESLPGLRDGGRGVLGRFGRAPRSFVVALARVRDYRPDVIIGLGGYGSLPVALVGAALRIPLYLIEPNVVPGRANRLLARIARETWTQFEETGRRLHPKALTYVTGNPLRGGITRVERARARGHFGLGHDATVLLILGGSQGAEALNRLILDGGAQALAERVPRLEVLHIAGAGDDRVAALGDAYAGAGVPAHVIPFSDRMELAYSAADVALTRAGAGTLAELMVCGVPAVLVPYPHQDGHQECNARWMDEHGAAACETESDPARIRDRLIDLLTERTRRDDMASRARRLARPAAADEVVRRLENWGELVRT